MEDLCQLSERLTEDKYKGSMEQVTKVVKKYSSNPMLDALTLFEITLFSFLIGNAGHAAVGSFYHYHLRHLRRGSFGNFSRSAFSR